MERLEELEKAIGYEFRQKGLLRQALTHSSYANERHMRKLSDNERLEFLGDAVLELVSSDFLYRNYAKLPEGDLTKLRASIVCEPTLALCTRQMRLGSYLFLGKGEDQTGGRTRKSILSDALEALIGAIYLDGGFSPAQKFIQRFILTDIEHKKLFYDSKTILQELVQGTYKESLHYELLAEEGPDHDKNFRVAVKIGEESWRRKRSYEEGGGTGGGLSGAAAPKAASVGKREVFMYLKSIEVQGFKSFANKILFDFHNGITGIVGPNGSGKSNVADAVRWVLGEQSAKQLRGASMQDVIFAGTENRKPLSYAYVAITMDNSDHQLAIDFEEVTVARRVYRSGESEYLINGSPCRLKDVTELFYDTGIGKEGYSIIGQGQIERILSGKPEERRELFDEAAGIVKYKKRKATAQKKLENERENLVRVNDILAELERQVGPLERQAQKARVYLKKKEELKTYDVNMFLLEAEHIDEQQKDVQAKFETADQEAREAKDAYEQVKSEYERMEQELSDTEEKLTTIRENLSSSAVMKGKLEGQINVLNEQIHTAEMTDEHLKSRLASIDREKEERLSFLASYDEEQKELRAGLLAIAEKRGEAVQTLEAVRREVARCTEGIESGKNALMGLLNQRASIKARQQRFDTMSEQMNIRKAQLTKRLLARKTEEADLDAVLSDYQKELERVNAVILEKKREAAAMEEKEREWKKKSAETREQLEREVAQYHKEQSRLDSLKNIAERYDGYGSSIRRVMEQRAKHPGLLGVVSDLIQVEKKYETAIETALGGNIQNIVTEDEETAKQMISYLKQNRFGRATFLPLTSVNGKGNFKNMDALQEKGVMGLAHTLVKTDAKYEGVIAYLLGRVVVTEHIDAAVALARKYRYSLHIVTLEGEYLSPGGSLTGGAFKNSSNLLARKREIEELEQRVASLETEIQAKRNRMEDIKTARALLEEDAGKNKAELQEADILQNTAKLNAERAKEQKNESESVFAGLQLEGNEIENQMREIAKNKALIEQEIAEAKQKEQELEEETKRLQQELLAQGEKETAAQEAVSALQMEEAAIRQKEEFVLLNLERINGEIKRYEDEREGFLRDAKEAKQDAEKKRGDIEEIKKTILASEDACIRLEQELQETIERKEELSAAYKGFFKKREELGEKLTALDKEIFRLNSQRREAGGDAGISE